MAAVARVETRDLLDVVTPRDRVSRGRTAMLGDASVVYVEPGDTFARIADGEVGPPDASR